MPALEDLYREIILDHYRSPRNRGELATPPAHRVEGFNPLCGDEVVVYLLIDGDKVENVRFSGQGCSISQSSASMMSEAVKGRPLREVRALLDSFRAMLSSSDEGEEAVAIDTDSLGEIAALQGVVKFPVRVKCATLSWNTLAQALDEVAAGVSAGD